MGTRGGKQSIKKVKETGSRLRSRYPAGAVILFGIAKHVADSIVVEHASLSPDEIRDRNLIAITFSAFAVEGFIDELGEYYAPARFVKQNRLKVLHRVLSLAEEGNLRTLSKLMLIHEILGKPLELGHQPLQDYQLLQQLRHSIVHPKTTTEVVELPSFKSLTPISSLLKRLHSKILLVDDPKRMSQWFLNWLTSPKLGRWALETAAKVIVTTIEALPTGDCKMAMAVTFRECFLGDESRLDKIQKKYYKI